MKNSLLTIILLLSTTLAYTDSICENYFLINHNRKNLKTFHEINNKRIQYYNDNITNSSDPELQIKLINEQFQYELNLFYHSMENIKQSKKALRLQNDSPDEYLKFIELKKNKLIRRHAEQVDIITKSLGSILKQHSVPHKLVKSKISSFDVPYHYIELDLSQYTKYSSLKVLKKYQELFGIPSFTIDLMKNIRNGSLGFKNTTQIDMGVDGIQNILIDDLLLLVTKHESKHASFQRQRELYKKSPFHTWFLATGVNPLSSVTDAGYRTYMSAEELYNFANNPFWISTRLRKADSFNFTEKVADFYRMQSQVHAAGRVAAQTKELTQSFKKLLTEARDIHIPNKNFSMTFLDRTGNSTISFEEAVSFTIFHSEAQQYATFFIEKHLRKATKEYLTLNNKVIEELNEIVRVKGAPKTQAESNEFYQNFVEKESKATHHLQMRFVKNAIRQISELEVMANKIIKAAPILNKKQKEFFDSITTLIQTNDNYLNSQAWRQDFQEQAQLVREFGNLVKVKAKKK